ncbi:MAG: signal peptidase I [Acidobacteria bacterium]|nr:signal peptidase I [Acidobacteriota bacterium]
MPKSIIREYFEQLIITVIMALFLMTFITQAVAVPTGSMQNTINIGDHLSSTNSSSARNRHGLAKFLPSTEIKRGDVIVFKLPSDPKTNYVKRVIGLPGDMVLVKGTRVYVNGQELPEQKVTVRLAGDYQHRSALEVVKENPAPAGGATKSITTNAKTGEGDDSEYRDEICAEGADQSSGKQLFMMGDSRDNSLDSRYWGLCRGRNVRAGAHVHWSFNPLDPDFKTTGNRILDLFLKAKTGAGQALRLNSQEGVPEGTPSNRFSIQQVFINLSSERLCNDFPIC